MERMIQKKLCLGTVQFGLDYGIANSRGMVGKAEVAAILAHAHSQEIDCLDTAHSYGESEKVLGEFIQDYKPGFKVISKLSPLGSSTQSVESLFHESLVNLKLKKLYGYLVHRFDDYRTYKELMSRIQRLKKEGKVEKIGFSLYSPSELEKLFSDEVRFDIIQVPYSVFDRRFSKYFEQLKARGVEIHVRSVFLQGLAFLSPEAVPSYLAEAREHLGQLRRIAAEKEIPINAICLNFALVNPYVDKVVIGVDSLQHLKDNIQNAVSADKVSCLLDVLEELEMENEDILLPYRWHGGRK